MKIKTKNFTFVDLDELEAHLSQILHQQSLSEGLLKESLKESIKLHELHELHGVDSSCKIRGGDSPELHGVKAPKTRKTGRPRKTKFETRAITTQSESDDE